jgi:hypothetical protein
MAKLTGSYQQLTKGRWPQLIGEFIIAMSALEERTSIWLSYLEPNEQTLLDLLCQSLQARTDAVSDYIDENPALDIAQKEDIRNTWMAAMWLGGLRERLTRRPAILVRPLDSDESIKPDLLHSPTLYDLHTGELEQTLFLSISDLEQAIERAYQIGNALDAQLQQFV